MNLSNFLICIRTFREVVKEDVRNKIEWRQKFFCKCRFLLVVKLFIVFKSVCYKQRMER